MRYRSWPLVSVVAGIAVVVAGCGSESGPTATASSPTTGTHSTPSTTAGTTVAATDTTISTLEYAVVPALDALSRPIPGATLPHPREDMTTHGGSAFGVFFAALTGPGSSLPEARSAGWRQLNEADQRLRDNFGGEFFGERATDCDPGAVEALAAQGIPNAVAYVVLHFPTEADALAFAAAVEPPPLAVAPVVTMCRD